MRASSRYMHNKEKVGVTEMIGLVALLLSLLDEEFLLFNAKEVAEDTVSATDNNCPQRMACH